MHVLLAGSIHAALLLASSNTCLQEPNSTRPRAVQVEPRTDTNSIVAHQELVQKARLGGIDVYFVGDSITRRWGATDPEYGALLKNFQTNFFGWNAADFGWGGDRVQNILWRLQNGELDGVHPKVIVVLAGINNVGVNPGPGTVEEVTRGLKAIVQTCQAKAPQAILLLMGLFPRNDNMAVIPTIRHINQNLALLANGKQVRYLDINGKLADKNGRFFSGMVNPDQLHPTLQAYQIWAEALKPLLTEILGPPAKTDHAPPPTGNPATRQTR